MKKLPLLIMISGLLACYSIQAQETEMDRFINDLMGKMTLEEKIGQLNLTNLGYGVVTGAATSNSPQEKIKNGQVGAILSTSGPANVRKAQDLAVKESRLKIPLIFGMDVIHGHKTIFPIPLAIACTWDPDLIEKSARIAATEASADGLDWVYSPMVDLARDPRWGRVAEGAGEDPYLGSLIAAAMVRGHQGPGLDDTAAVMSCVKHYALYGAAEAGRDYNTVDMSLIRMYQDYLPPYKAAVQAGAGSIMTSFNDINGIPATANHWLLTEVLRDQWGFDGFVVTDYSSMMELTFHGLGDLKHVAALALRAGVDMDMMGDAFVTTLKQSLEDGSVSMADINLACRRVLEAKYKLGLFEDPYRRINEDRAKREIMTPANFAFARELARKSMVLLKNENQLLPLKKDGTIAVVGPLADSPSDMLGTWAFFGDRSKIVTVLKGIENAVGDRADVVYAKGANFTDDPVLAGAGAFYGMPGTSKSWEELAAETEVLIKEAIEKTKNADVIVAALGEQAAWSGEASSRSDISIPDSQERLLKALLATGKPVVLVLVNGRPLTIPWEDASVPAILESWAGGTEAGSAVADILFGDYNPSGKLTMTFPRSVGQIPIYYNHKNTGRPFDARNKFTSKYLDITNEPLYPFGYGLSYTTFDYGDIKVSKSELKGDETLAVSVTVTNTGSREGEETVQLYIGDHAASITRPVMELKDFKKMVLKPGEKKEVTFNVTTDDLKFWNTDLQYIWEPGEFVIYVGPNSRDLKQVSVNWL